MRNREIESVSSESIQFTTCNKHIEKICYIFNLLLTHRWRGKERWRETEKAREPIIILSLWWPCIGYVESVTSQYFISVSNFGGACTFPIVYCFQWFLVSLAFRYPPEYCALWAACRFRGHSDGSESLHSLILTWLDFHLCRTQNCLLTWKIGTAISRRIDDARGPRKWNGPTQIMFEC